MSEHQKQTVEGLVIDLIRIRASAKDIESILDAALSNASGNPEYDSVSRRVRGFREAILCLPEPEGEPNDTELLNHLEEIAIKEDLVVEEDDGWFKVCGFKIKGTAEGFRAAIANSIKDS